MSVQALTWAFAAKELSPSEKLTLLSLANHASNKECRCFPSQDTLAEETGLSSRTIRAALKSLEGAGLIVRNHRQRKDGSRTTDEYFLQLHAEKSSARNVIQPENNAGQPETLSGLTTFEPSLEPSLKEISVEDEFEEFWKAYPRESRKAKPKALAAYRRARKKTDAAALIAALRAYINTKPDWQAFKWPQGWLNDERWLDETGPPAMNGGERREYTEEEKQAAIAAYWEKRNAQYQ